MSTFYNSTDQFFHIDPTEVDDLQKCIWRLVCNATWLGTFSITFILFILLSTKRQRKSILFSIQCGLFILTIIYNSTALTNANSRFNMVWIEEEDQNKYWNFARLDVANLSLEHWITILADGSLLVHILSSFFPSDRFKNQQRLIYVLPFLIIMVARIILTIINSYYTWMKQTEIRWVPNRSVPLSNATRWEDEMEKTSKAEYALAGTYGVLISSFLLYKVYTISESASQMEKDIFRPNRPIEIALKSVKLVQKAILMTYILPISFRFAILGLFDCSNQYCYDRELSLTIVNTSVICSIFATTWSSIKPLRSKDEIEKDCVEDQKDMDPVYKSFGFGSEVQERSNSDTLIG